MCLQITDMLSVGGVVRITIDVKQLNAGTGKIHVYLSNWYPSNSSRDQP